MSREHAIGQEVAEIFLREAVHDELGHEVQIGARIDIVRDAGGDDAEDGRGALAADIAPREEQFLRPRQSLRNSRSRRLFVISILPSSRNRVRRGHWRWR